MNDINEPSFAKKLICAVITTLIFAVSTAMILRNYLPATAATSFMITDLSLIATWFGWNVPNFIRKAKPAQPYTALA